ncbi:hypothetical protein H0S58_06505 [Acinetobacter sp. TTH0-4]|uniref:virulence factor TspB C-terminal domain-related protein n=1 Tax=Acinetobacter sp. TTH0-4 TaxID=1646498 RepID=UPI00189EE378|nr:virulence factor TspB C-terminal domain-related protein [Acinetobacter sp. TTH0-4]QPF39121.1 hypothetical protein H0S58_06505 [Acinetobacter sp. TTH0-4]
MYSHVGNCWHKTVLSLIKIIVCFTLVYTPFFANASAAEKWEYDVIPDQSQTLKIKGHKVDQYGAAVNDYDYNTKIDPKTSSNKFKMGTVGMGRLLKTTGWGLLGSAALEALLKSVDWIIDPETQSIWRNKRNTDSGGPQCSGSIIQNGITYSVKWQSWGGKTFNCPLEAAKDTLEYRQLQHPNNFNFTFLRWRSDSNEGKANWDKSFFFTSPWGEDFMSIQVVKDSQITPEKEYLTPEQLADYANKTHKDYSDPQLAPKLEPKYSPSIQTDLWKPSNPWEETNSPTVQEVKKELEKSAPEPKTDPEIKPNPETGGLALPSFCSWAVPVCEFINWVKDNPENENDVPETPKEIDIGALDTGTFKATAGCPAPIQVPISFGKGGNVEISYEPICQMAEKWSFVAPLIGFISGAMILIGVGRKGEDGEL